MKKLKAIDYSRYSYTKAEYLRYGAMGYFIACGMFYLFYHHIFVSLFLAFPAMIFYLKYEKKQRIQKRRLELRLQFKDLMETLVASLSAGYSMENAIFGAKNDLSLLYAKDSYILKELIRMTNQIQIGRRTESLFEELGERSGLEDIRLFAQIYRTARYSGGNLVVVMRHTAENISEKIEMNREIETMITGKKLEAKCMMLIPLLLLAYLQICSPGFLNPLYSGLFGRMIMSAALLLYGGGFIWAQKIINIKF